MPLYSFGGNDEVARPEYAPYNTSRSAQRRRFGNRTIVSHGPEERLPGQLLTDEATWRDMFRNRAGTSQPATPGYVPPTYYNEQNPLGTTSPGRVTSGTQLVSPYGTASVRSASDVAAGNAPYDVLGQPTTPMPKSPDLLPAARTADIPQRPSMFSGPPSADDYIGAILSRPSALNITTGVLSQMSPWKQPL